MKKFLEPIQRYFDDPESDPVEHVQKSPVFWVLGVLFLAWLIIEAPRWQASRVTLTDPDKYFQVENEARKTILQGLGGGFFFISAYFTWRNLQVSEKTRQVTEDKQISERFTNAVEMLADEKERLDVRLGAIYALERLAKDSPKDRWTVVELLAAYVRRTSIVSEAPIAVLKRRDGKVSEDIQASLAVIVEKQAPKEEFVDLHGADLRGASLEKAKLDFAYLPEINLSHASLGQASLSAAVVAGAKLESAFLVCANINFTCLEYADLRNADLGGAELNVALLNRANLENAKLCGASLRGALLREADLTGAELKEADLEGADLEGADLKKADLRYTANLKCKQIREAKNWELAIYDLELAEQLGLDKDEQIRRAKEWDETHKP